LRATGPAVLGLAAAAVAAGGCGAAGSPAVSLVRDGASVSAARSNPVTVSPLPGTADAMPGTQISFLGGPGTQVSAVRAVGSRSGVHGGVLRAYSTGTGESFLVSRPFAPGESVRVSARVSSGGHVRVARTSFSIAHYVVPTTKEFPAEKGQPSAVQHFVSAPGLTPSSVRITTPAAPGASPGDLFLAPYQGDGTAGPMIAAQDGSLVWFHPLPRGIEATNFGVQNFAGEPVLTWWQGRIIEFGFGLGHDVVYDTHYRRVAGIRAGNGLSADLHVLRLTSQGTAWIDAYEPVRMNLAGVGGSSSGVLSDGIVQEIDVRTGLVMWEWHALGHIPLRESNNPVPASGYPWDYVHVNSVDPGTNGDVLLGFRNTWSLEDVDIHSGGTRWRLGGARSTFKLGPGATFYWQHDGQFQGADLVSMFDNGSDPPKEKRSRGLLLKLDPHARSARIAGQFADSRRALLASSQGNLLALPGGNWLLGYGWLPNFTEFAADGRVLLDGTLGPGVQSFTTRLAPWSATAPGRPAVAATAAVGGGVRVAVSWNGATDVASWRLLAGSAPDRLAPVADARRSGFETVLQVAAGGPYIQVQALDGGGTVLGASPIERV
jgi:hypothetical protein